MSYAIVEDIPASWEHHAAVAPTGDRIPRGLLLHVAGPTDEGFRIIEIWRSEADWQRFALKFKDAVDSIDPVAGRRTVVRDLRAPYLVVGEGWLDEARTFGPAAQQAPAHPDASAAEIGP